MWRMGNDSPLVVIWRRKGVVLATFLVFVIATAIVSETLGKVYTTHSTLLVSLPAGTSSFDAVQASGNVAQSYADIIASPNIAQRVAGQTGLTRDEVQGDASFQPITDTQLLEIDTQASTPERAKQIADSYARVFIDYARSNLQPTTRATLSLADTAPLPTAASRPKPTLYTLIAAIIGLAIGVALAFARDRFDDRLRHAHDVESHFDSPVLGRIPRRRRSDSSVTAFKEAHRILRTNLQFASTDRRLRSIAVTSGREGEGKTTTLAQLALTSAEVGQRVIVVEADFRRPALQRELIPDVTEPLRPGLSNYLVEAASIDDVLYPSGRPNIDIVPAGPLPPSPSALLESRRAGNAVGDFLGEADLVLIDCPPLNIGADASVIAGWVDGVIVVVDLAGSTDHIVRDALRQLEAVHANTVGLVLNRDPGVGTGGYDYYMQAPNGQAGSRSKPRQPA